MPNATEWVTVTRADIEAMRKHPNAATPNALCLCCDGLVDDHQDTCAYAAGAETMLVHRDCLIEYALVRMDGYYHDTTDTECLLCGHRSYWPQDMSDHHDGDCSLEGVVL